MKKLTIKLLQIFFLTSILILPACQEDENINDEPEEKFIKILTPLKEFTKVYPNSQYEITWNTNITGPVKLEVFDNTGTLIVFDETILAENKSYTWNIPSDICYSAEARFRISSINNPDITSESVYSYTLGTPNQTEYLKVVSPNGGETYTNNRPFLIQWSTNSVNRVLIYIYYENTQVGYFHTPVNYTQNSMSAILSDFEAGNKYRIYLTLENKPEISDFSDNYFTLNEP